MSQPQEMPNIVSAESRFPAPANEPASAGQRQLSLVIPFFGLVDACMVFSTDRRRFGDKWAKTLVVKNNPALDLAAKG